MKLNFSDVEELTKLSKEVHGDKYDYSQLTPTTNREKSIIGCPIHGPFKQRIYMHIVRKQGCPKCEGLNMNTEEFIKQSIKIHKGRYSYPRAIFRGKMKKTIITCDEHGDFEQLAFLHLKGHGCPYCAGCARSNKEKFEKKANMVHDYIYDYSKVKYKNAHISVEIVCRKHGSFWQTPNKHLIGHGCPNCYKSKGEILIEKILKNNKIYFIYHKTFDDCIFKRKLQFDFYLPDYNICIEYDGEQHITNYRFEKDLERLKVRKIRDKIKNIYCEEKRIKLYRISHKEDVLNKLKEILDDCKI
jgi:hypothetical protein